MMESIPKIVSELKGEKSKIREFDLNKYNKAGRLDSQIVENFLIYSLL